MGALFVYILKSSVCLAAFYLFYRCLLSKNTFHQSNRFVLLGLLFFSLTLPCFEVTVEQPVEIQQKMVKWERIFIPEQIVSQPTKVATPIIATAPVAEWTWQEIVLSIYLLGILFFFIRIVYSLLRMAFLLYKSKFRKLDDGVTLVVHECKFAPFSCMKYIVISVSDLEDGGGEIIMHERAHIHSCHSLDLLVAELIILFQWFNPVAWLFKQELQNIHEYEADEAVLNQGIDAKQYQLLLIKKAVGPVRFNSLANNFNHSKLKKRIAMMLKRKSNPWSRLKYLCILPLAVMIVTVFARPGISGELNGISKLKINDLVSVAEKNISESLLEEEVNDLPGAENEAQSEFPEVVNDTVFLRDTVFVIRKDTATFSALIKKKPVEESARMATMREFLASHPYAWIVVNQKEMRAYEVHPEDVGDGNTIYYPLDMSKRFGKRALGGVMLVNTDEAFFKNVIVKNGSYEALMKFAKNEDENSIVLDGEDIDYEDLQYVDPCEIRSVSFESETAYVSTDTGHWIGRYLSSHPDILVILHGKEMDVKKVRRSHYLGVKRISTYEGDQTARFGPKAKNGVLFIGEESFQYQLSEKRN